MEQMICDIERALVIPAFEHLIKVQKIKSITAEKMYSEYLKERNIEVAPVATSSSSSGKNGRAPKKIAEDKNRCYAKTKKGGSDNRCTNTQYQKSKFKLSKDATEEHDAIKKYCYQHNKTIANGGKIEDHPDAGKSMDIDSDKEQQKPKSNGTKTKGKSKTLEKTVKQAETKETEPEEEPSKKEKTKGKAKANEEITDRQATLAQLIAEAQEGDDEEEEEEEEENEDGDEEDDDE